MLGLAIHGSDYQTKDQAATFPRTKSDFEVISLIPHSTAAVYKDDEIFLCPHDGLPIAQAPSPHDSKSGWARQHEKSREDYSQHNPARVMRPMHWSKYLQPDLPSSKRSRASHSSRLRRYVRKVQRSVRVLVEIRKSSFGSCFSGVVFCLLRMFPLNGRKLRVEVVPWRSRRMPGSWMWTWCGGQLFAQAPQPAQLLSSKEERASQCDRASGVALLEQVALDAALVRPFFNYEVTCVCYYDSEKATLVFCCCCAAHKKPFSHAWKMSFLQRFCN